MENLSQRFGRLTAGIGLICLLTLSLGILGDAFLRSAFNSPIYGLSDLSELVTPVIVASCFPLALYNRQNITIRFLGRALPARPGQLVELFGRVMALIVLIGITWELGRYTAGLIRYAQYTWLLQLPVWPSWVLATTMIAACIPIQAQTVWETLRHLRAGTPLGNTEQEFEDDVEQVI